MRILFRDPASSAGSVSPFWQELLATASGGTVDIACPYISVPRLGEIARVAPKLRILTDAKEWLRSYPRGPRQDILAFIARNTAVVRICADLHAKVAESPHRVFFGSANFTERGLERRHELCAVSEHPADVAAVQGWFNALWSTGSAISMTELEAFERELPEDGSAEGQQESGEGPPELRGPPPIPEERVLRGASGDLFDEASESYHRGLEQLANELKRLGFKVEKKRDHERTLRVYPVKIREHPLLNPRFRPLENDEGSLEITVLSGTPAPKVELAKFVSTPECWYDPIGTWHKPYHILGRFVLPLTFSGPPESCDIEFQRLASPLQAILDLFH
jgi:hypothetical protein